MSESKTACSDCPHNTAKRKIGLPRPKQRPIGIFEAETERLIEENRRREEILDHQYNFTA